MDFFGSIYDTPVNNNDEYLNIYSLSDDFVKKSQQRTKIYTEVLKKIHYKIKQAATNMKKYCMIAIPEYVIGMPLYDMNNCKTFLMNRLIDEGFDLKFYVPNLLNISWEKVVNSGVQKIDRAMIQTIKPSMRLKPSFQSSFQSSIKPSFQQSFQPRPSFQPSFQQDDERHVSWNDKAKKNKLTYVSKGLFDF